MSTETATKACSKCGLVKPVENFHLDSGCPDGRHRQCAECRNGARRRRWAEDSGRVQRARQSNREHYRNNRERISAQNRAAKILRLYGLSVAEYEALVAQPCAICDVEENICVDHDHATGEVRGPLCARCNTAIGLLRDNPEHARRAALYLEG